MNREQVLDFLIKKLGNIAENEGLSMPDKLDENTKIFGAGGLLDSMLLVEIMLSLEDFCADNNVRFVWETDSAMSSQRSVYATVGSLADFVLSLPEKDG